MPLVYLEAEYADGFVLREDDEDRSSFDAERNVFWDILHKLHQANHGPMVRLALVCPDNTYTIDWTALAYNARPIRFKHMERDLNEDGEWIGEARIMRIDFGYQFTDDNGHNVQEVQEIAIAAKN